MSECPPCPQCPNSDVSPLACLKWHEDHFPVELPADPQGNSVASCASRCREQDFSYAGVRNGSECHCGHVQPTANEDYDRPGYYCTTACPGDPGEICGGGGAYVSAYYVRPAGVCDVCLVGYCVQFVVLSSMSDYPTNNTILIKFGLRPDAEILLMSTD